MTATAKDLKTAWEKAEADAVALQQKKDADLDALREKYGDRLRAAVDKAAEAQKAYLNREALEELLSRDDQVAAKSTAVALGLPTDEFAE
jgi:hypothetical protein